MIHAKFGKSEGLENHMSQLANEEKEWLFMTCDIVAVSLHPIHLALSSNTKQWFIYVLRGHVLLTNELKSNFCAVKKKSTTMTKVEELIYAQLTVFVVCKRTV